MTPAENVNLIIRTDKETLYKAKHRKIFPSIMLRIPIKEIPPLARYIEVLFEAE